MDESLKDWQHIKFTENFKDNSAGTFFTVKQVLYSGQSSFQRIDVLDTYNLGKILVLDGITQTVDAFEFPYHEMITHVAMCGHINPKRVLIIGGGDGGTLREVLKHKTVEDSVMCEIDEMVVRVAEKYLPKLSSAFSDERAKFAFTDGAAFVKEFDNMFDVILIDSTDPTAGEGGTLFTEEFYEACKKALTPDGLVVAQTENPFYDRDWMKVAHNRIKKVFPVTKMYTSYSPQYPSGFWTYTIGSKTTDPEFDFDETRTEGFELNYYNAKVHKAAFALPNFLNKFINE